MPNSLGHEHIEQGLARDLSSLGEGHHFHTGAVDHVGHRAVELLKPPVAATEEWGRVGLMDSCSRGRGRGRGTEQYNLYNEIAPLGGPLHGMQAQVEALLAHQYTEYRLLTAYVCIHPDQINYPIFTLVKGSSRIPASKHG